jgi:hypothetical protein
LREIKDLRIGKFMGIYRLKREDRMGKEIKEKMKSG